MYICVKFPPRDLNPTPYPSHHISTYTCGVTIAPMVYGGVFEYIWHNMTCRKSTNTNYYAYIKIQKLTMKLDKITPNDY